LLTFGIKRTFRIYPLLWLTVGLTLLITPKLYNPTDFLLSITGLFGFVKPAAGLGTGVWSIGNELVFYTTFPILILVAQFSRPLFLGIAAILIGISVYFGFYVLTETQPIAKQWPWYVNALNQMVLFVGGMLIGYLALKFPEKRPAFWLIVTVIIAAWLLFIFYPAYGDRITLVAGWNRVIFLSLSFLICGAVFYLNYQLPAFLHKPLALTAEISFGLYLLHPIVYFFATAHFQNQIEGLDPTVLVLIIAVLAYAFSYLAFRFIEMPVVNLGKIFTEKLKIGPSTKKHGENPFL
jgi:peptidoglycan/LPS O-acetylase OafA/YrhL